MNTYKWILGFAFAMFFSFSVQAQNVQGVMMVVKGDIKVTSTDGKTEAAKVGKKVSAGDTIVAGPDSRAKIVMADKNVINVSPDSKIVIEKYENDGKDKKNVELNVVYGKVRASVEQKYDGDKSKFNVKTPSAVAGVRGTDFMMGYNAGTKRAQVITFSGSVAVGQPGPGGTIRNPVFVNAGQMTQAGAGQTPEAPKAVPKEDLNNMNNETKADSASNGKKDAGSNVADSGSDKKDNEKKDKSEGDANKREPASDSGKKEGDAKKDPAAGGDSGKKDGEGKKDAGPKDGTKRDPASGNSGGLITSGDLPGGPNGANGGMPGASPGTGPNVPPPVIRSPTSMLPPPPPPPPPPTGSKSKVNIIIKK